MQEVRERLDAIEASLPRHMDIMAVSPLSKLPFKALSYRETLIWRMAELSRDAYEQFCRDRLASAILLTRASVETCAALWFLKRKITAAVKAGAIGDIDSYLVRLAVGSRVEPGPQPINVLNFVDAVDKDLEGFRHQYDILSEFAHPNWAGTTGLYSQINQGDHTVAFGSNPRELTGPKHVGVLNLSVALGLFEHTSNSFADDFGRFVALCEASIKPQEPEAP